jgi:hypothetical protein
VNGGGGGGSGPPPPGGGGEFEAGSGSGSGGGGPPPPGDPIMQVMSAAHKVFAWQAAIAVGDPEFCTARERLLHVASAVHVES